MIWSIMETETKGRWDGVNGQKKSMSFVGSKVTRSSNE